MTKVVELNNLSHNPGARKKRKCVGRGIGSGKGKTCGRGGKGQTARSGVSIKGFEGGQMPMIRRIPKRGFTNFSRCKYAELNLSRLQMALDDGRLSANDIIDAALLKERGVLKQTYAGVKILGKGSLNAKITLKVAKASKSAIKIIEDLGGSIHLASQQVV